MAQARAGPLLARPGRSLRRAIVDVIRKIEMHMWSDRPGLIIRRRLLTLMTARGEVEVPAS
jgi:hypothetical protein